jgi:gliding motility-associated lipoprotein GldH
LKHYLLSVFFIVTLAACGPKVIFDEHKDISTPWKYQDAIQYNYEIVDTSLAYDLSLIVKHAIDFSYENLYIKTTTTFPDGKMVLNPVSLQLSDPSGNWIGDCNSQSCKTNIEIFSGAHFKNAGKYGLSIEQFSRDEQLSGIQGFQLKITEHQSQH